MKATAWRKFINGALKNVAKLSFASVINIGANQDYQDKEGHLYRDYFNGKDYWTMDIGRYKEHPKHIKHDITTPYSRTWDMVICMNVLEHCVNPFLAADTLTKMTRKFLFVTVPFFYPIHKNRCMNDYWRFTDDSLRLLFAGFDELWISGYKDGAGNIIGFAALFGRSK